MQYKINDIRELAERTLHGDDLDVLIHVSQLHRSGSETIVRRVVRCGMTREVPQFHLVVGCAAQRFTGCRGGRTAGRSWIPPPRLARIDLSSPLQGGLRARAVRAQSKVVSSSAASLSHDALHVTQSGQTRPNISMQSLRSQSYLVISL